MEKRKSLLIDKILFTCLIGLVYLIGRSVHLAGVDASAYSKMAEDMQSFLMQTVSGDQNQISILALGIVPHITASILVQIGNALRRADKKSKTSPITLNRITVEIMLITAFIQAFTLIGKLHYLPMTGAELVFTKVVNLCELLAGALILLFLAERNKKYGIGGQTMLIFINVVDGILRNVISHSFSEMILPILLGLLLMVVMLALENAERRIPVQRISIHNIHADRNYLALKFNPVGVMPIMFASSLFTLPQIITNLLLGIYPQNESLQHLKDRLVLTDSLGIMVYIFIVFFLTIAFSMVMLSPTDIAEQYLKTGDSIVGVRAGKETKRLIRHLLLRSGFFSASVMSLCVALPMWLQMGGDYNPSLLMFPTSCMILAGVYSNISREVHAIKNLDSYHSFL